MTIKTILRMGVNRLGFDVVRFHNSPGRTLLGMVNRDIRTVIDVGANEGQFARMASAVLPKADLYCFEPLEEPFGRLTAWAETQDGRVRCFQLALGDMEGEADMHLHEEHTPSSSLLAATEQCHRIYPQTRAERMARVRVSTLDRALEGTLDRMPLDILLKLDVQGFEDRVLRGGERVLAETRACLLEVCLDHLYEEQADFRGLTEFLYDAGFHYAGNVDQVYGDDGRVIYLDAVFLR